MSSLNLIVPGLATPSNTPQGKGMLAHGQNPATTTAITGEGSGFLYLLQCLCNTESGLESDNLQNEPLVETDLTDSKKTDTSDAIHVIWPGVRENRVESAIHGPAHSQPLVHDQAVATTESGNKPELATTGEAPTVVLTYSPGTVKPIVVTSPANALGTAQPVPGKVKTSASQPLVRSAWTSSLSTEVQGNNEKPNVELEPVSIKPNIFPNIIPNMSDGKGSPIPVNYAPVRVVFPQNTQIVSSTASHEPSISNPESSPLNQNPEADTLAPIASSTNEPSILIQKPSIVEASINPDSMDAANITANSSIVKHISEHTIIANSGTGSTELLADAPVVSNRIESGGFPPLQKSDATIANQGTSAGNDLPHADSVLTTRAFSPVTTHSIDNTVPVDDFVMSPKQEVQRPSPQPVQWVNDLPVSTNSENLPLISSPQEIPDGFEPTLVSQPFEQHSGLLKDSIVDPARSDFAASFKQRDSELPVSVRVQQTDDPVQNASFTHRQSASVSSPLVDTEHLAMWNAVVPQDFHHHKTKTGLPSETESNLPGTGLDENKAVDNSRIVVPTSQGDFHPDFDRPDQLAFSPGENGKPFAAETGIPDSGSLNGLLAQDTVTKLAEDPFAGVARMLMQHASPVNPVAGAYRRTDIDPLPVLQQIFESPGVIEGLEKAGHIDEATVRIELRPARLGEVSVEIKQMESVIKVHIVADRAVTHAILERNLDSLVQAFREQGNGAVDVDVSHRHSHHNGQESTSNPRLSRDQRSTVPQSDSVAPATRQSTSNHSVDIFI